MEDFKEIFSSRTIWRINIGDIGIMRQLASHQTNPRRTTDSNSTKMALKDRAFVTNVSLQLWHIVQ